MQVSKNGKSRSFKFENMAWSVIFSGMLAIALAAFACMPATSQALNKTDWTFLGPSPVARTTPADSKTNISGRITGIAAHPSNADIIFAASAGGGVWKTTDGGATWTPLTDSQVTLSMGAIAISPLNPNMIYAGTGESNNRWDSNYGKGILVSTDGGTSWTLRTAGGAFDRQTTSGIAVDPSDPSGNTAYAAMAGIGINGLSNNTGIWKTTNGGVTWVNTTSSIDASAPWSDVAIDPDNPSTLYAAIGNQHGAFDNGVYKSINSGTSWTLLANAPSGGNTGRITIAVAKSNPLVIYVSVSSPLDASWGALYKFMRSDDGGATFTDLTAGTPNYMGVQGFYNTALIVDPANAGIVYAGGEGGTYNNGIIRSANGGVDWTDISSGGAPDFTSPHINSHSFSFNAGGKLLAGNDGGIYRLDDPAVPSWKNLNGNLGTILFYGLGLHPANPYIAVGGTADNGTILFTGNPVWTLTDSDGAGFDGGVVRFSKTNPNRVYHQSPPYSAGWDFFRRSDDGGNTWTTETSTMPADPAHPELGPDIDQFFAPFVVDPGDGDHVLYGTIRVWETVNGGAAWSRISDVNQSGFNNNGNRVDAIGLAPSNANTIYAATGGDTATSSQIFVTTDHGVTWTERNLGVGGRVKDIQVDPVDALVAYVAISTFNAPNGQVYMTNSGGASWTDITGNLPAKPVWSLQIDPATSPKTLYAGTDDGVYATTDGGGTWDRFGEGLPYVQVFHVELNTSLHILGAATHGRGLWEILTPNAGDPPAVTLTSPADGATFTQPVTITLTATATANGTATISKVEFYNGDALLGTDTTSPYGFDWSDAPSGMFTLTAKAYDSMGATTVSTGVTVNVSANSSLTVTPVSAFFGNVSVNFTSSPASFTVANNGMSGSPLTISSITLEGADPLMFQVVKGTCGTLPVSLPVGASCNFAVTFSPTATGPRTASVAVESLNEGTVFRTITGSGVSASDPLRRTAPAPEVQYATMTDAFAAATGNATLQAMSLTLSAPALSVNSTGTVNFVGGFDSLWGSRTGVTTMRGVLTIKKGTLVADGLTIM